MLIWQGIITDIEKCQKYQENPAQLKEKSLKNHLSAKKKSSKKIIQKATYTQNKLGFIIILQL